MRKFFAVLLLVSPLAAFAHPGQVCTKEPKDKWQDQTVFQNKLKEQGYEIKKFKVWDHCYEIYGKDKDGNKVEVYFNPVDGSVYKLEKH
jgi:hypothetical protein